MSRRDPSAVIACAALLAAAAAGCVRTPHGAAAPEPGPAAARAPAARAPAAPVDAGPAPAPVDEASGPEPELAAGPTRYPDGTVHSPLTEAVSRRVREIRAAAPGRQDRVFMKVGSSETVDLRYLRCFSGAEGSPFVVDLGPAERLRPTLEHFRQGDAGGRGTRRVNPFVRVSEAAKVGQSAAWAYAGARSPVAREIAAIDPAWAIVAFGSNDLNHGVSPLAALWPYHQHLTALIDRLAGAGVVPIVLGPSPRADSKAAARWAVVYDDVTRAVAESRQVPFVDLIEASVDLPGHGLVKDGVHGNAFTPPTRRGGVQPCVLTPEGLQFHYNVRNLVTLEALDRARRASEGDSAALEPPPLPAIGGSGSASDPVAVDRFPFSHVARFDPAAGEGVVYRLDLDAPRALRLMAFHEAGAAGRATLCATGPDPAPGACLARRDRVLASTFPRPAGVSHVIVSAAPDRRGRAAPGEILVVFEACADGDPDCAGPLR